MKIPYHFQSCDWAGRQLPHVAMQIATTHFGPIEIEMDDVLLFPRGIAGFEDCRHWVLISDEENPALAWLQSVSRSAIAVPVVSPRRFSPNYSVHVVRGHLLPLECSHFDQIFVLAVIGHSGGDLTLNLKAPLIINLDRRLGRQVVTSDDQPLALPLRPAHRTLRKSA